MITAVRYLPGGVASGFRHTDVNPEGDKKLYQVKGKKNIRVTQVYLRVTSYTCILNYLQTDR